MVKIQEYTERQPSALELSARKFDDLATITRELYGEYGDRNITLIEPGVAIGVELRLSECQVRRGILVIPDTNHLFVYNSIHYGLALRLAEKYEQKTKEEFTLEKVF